MWGERVDASVYICENEIIAKKTAKLAKKRLKKGYADNDIMEAINKENPLNLVIRSGLYAEGDDEYVDQATKEVGISQIASENGKKIIVQIYSVLEPQPKALVECRGLVTSDYQNYLERAWIAELREKYAYNIDRDVFKSIEKN
jgi:peptidyl-prolyl cis-trans isomerase SurA